MLKLFGSANPITPQLLSTWQEQVKAEELHYWERFSESKFQMQGGALYDQVNFESPETIPDPK